MEGIIKIKLFLWKKYQWICCIHKGGYVSTAHVHKPALNKPAWALAQSNLAFNAELFTMVKNSLNYLLLNSGLAAENSLIMLA